MIPLYDPKQDRIVPTGGVGGEQYESPSALMLNVLIELRVANLLAIELAKGNTNLTLEGLRVEVVTDVLPTTTS